MEIKLTIPDNKALEFKRMFLMVNPVPTDPETEKPLMTEAKWVKQWVKTQLLNAYEQGKKQEAQEQISIDLDILA